MSPDQINTILYRLDLQDALLADIKGHVEQTNGRVGKLELWRARMGGAVWALGLGTPVATGVFLLVAARLIGG